MRALFDFAPTTPTATITASSYYTGFPSSNLSDIKPMKRWQSDGYSIGAWVKYFNDSKFTFDSIFLNRFNFAKFQIEYSDADFNPGTGSGYSIWTPDTHTYFSSDFFQGLIKDELYDESYMHVFAMKSSSIQAKYVAIYIPISGNPPLYDPLTNYAIGNFLFGVSVDIWGASQNYARGKRKKLSINEFDSGYVEPVKMGRTKRVIRGSFNNITSAEMAKIRQTYNPFVFYEDCDDPIKAYLVRNIQADDTEQYQTDRPDLITYPFEFTELT